MSEQPFKHLNCPVVVLQVSEAHVMGDTVADALRDEFLAAYEQSGATHVVVDMHRISYLSSAGIRPLLALIRQVRPREGRLLPAALRPEVEGVLAATRLISSTGSASATFEKHPDVPAAIASLYQTAAP